jgi:hypothetical protein
MAGEVEPQAAMHDDGARAADAPPQQCTDARQQFIKIEWFDEVIVGAGIEAFNAGRRAVAR